MNKKQKTPHSFLKHFPLLMLLSALVDNFCRKLMDYMRAENRVLREQLFMATGRKCIYLTNDQRRLWAVKASLKVISELRMSLLLRPDLSDSY